MNKEAAVEVPKSRIAALDAMRGLAAVAVVFFHFALNQSGYETYFRFGTTGVDLFFIISGFVIFMSLQGAKTTKEFIFQRISRLYPAYWAGVIFSFTLISIHYYFSSKYPIETPFQTLLGNLTMLQYYLGIRDLEGPYWTMIVEMLFYIGMAILHRLRLLKHIFSIGLAVCAMASVMALNVDQSPWVKGIFMQIPLMYHVPLFFAGIVFYGLYEKSLEGKRAGLLLAAAFIAQLLLFPHTWRACKHMSLGEYTIILTLFFSAFTLFTRNRLNFIVNPFTLYLGRISYPLYLTHQYLTINLIIPYFTWKYAMPLWQAALLLALPAALLVATGIHHLVEVPGTRRLKRLLFGAIKDDTRKAA